MGNKENARRLTALAYFMLMAIGVTFSLAGVATKEIAATFAVDTAVVGYVFTLFSAGYSVAILGNGLLLERVAVGRETAVAATVAGAAVAAGTLLPSLKAFAAAIFVYGLGMGVLCSIGYFLIVRLYDETVRAAKLNILNFFFGVGSVAGPILAGQALQRGIEWQLVFQATVPLMAVAAVAALAIPFAPPQPARTEANGSGARWGAAVYVLGLALFCYVVSEMVFTYWVVTYMMERMAVEVATASLSLSVFWALMATGRLAAGPLIARIGVRRYILLFSLAAAAAFAALLAAKSPTAALGRVAVMGACYAGLDATILSYGTEQAAAPSSSLTTFFLTIGAGGGILAFLLSSWLKARTDVATVMTAAAALMAVVTLLVWSVRPAGRRSGGRG